MYCEKCGKEMREGAVFCDNCGNKIIETKTVSQNKIKPKVKYFVVIIICIIIILGGVLFATGGGQYKDEEIQDMIGKYVNYKPDNGRYVARYNLTGNEGNQEFSTEETMNWRIWSVDKNNIILVSDRPTNKGGEENDGELYLYGKHGYENGEKVLDELCRECYSNTAYKGIEVRSLKREDIEKVINKKVTNPKNETREYANQMIESYQEFGDDEYKNLKIEIDGWQVELKDESYVNPAYFELINDCCADTEIYYLSSKASVEGETGSGINSNSNGLQAIGGSDGRYICAIAGMYSKSNENGEYDEDEDSVYANVRPIVIIPLKSCKLDMSTSGTKSDKWEIKVK